MNLLALETATDRCSVALSVDAGVCARVDERPRVHARRVLGMVEACLAEGGIGAHEVDAYAFGRGPGSFTGVRIGAGVVQGLALGTGRPVVPVSTLAAHAVAARRLHGAVQTAVCVDARLGECYWGLYRVQEDGLAEALAPDALVRPEALEFPSGAGWFGAGTGWARWPELAAGLGAAAGFDSALLPEAADLLGLARRAFLAGEAVSPAEALPVYLREEVAWQGGSKG
jgi:tRNA threonylcarbamoyladenosine biosynthesis protein TsaB